MAKRAHARGSNWAGTSQKFRLLAGATPYSETVFSRMAAGVQENRLKVKEACGAVLFFVLLALGYLSMDPNMSAEGDVHDTR